MQRTLVVQSHREPLPAAWYQPCIESVRAWAAQSDFDYLWLDDELFAGLAPEILARTRDQRVVAADIGRLHALRDALARGYRQVVWLDADSLVIDPARLVLPDEDAAFGREIWIQPAQKSPRLRVYDKIHNAFMCFSAGNVVLDFYLHAAERLVMLHEGPMVPQLVGPKFLATLHNLLRFPVVETAAVLCPLLAADLLAGGSAGDSANGKTALQLFRERSRHPPAVLNLCGSMVAAGELSDAEMTQLVSLLQAQPGLLAGAG